jgi:hypothetical protein
MSMNKNLKTKMLPLKKLYVKSSSTSALSSKKNIKAEIDFRIKVRFMDNEIIVEIEYSLFSLNNSIDMFVKIIIIFEKDKDMVDDEFKEIAKNMNNIIKNNEEISKLLDDKILALSTLVDMPLPPISKILSNKQGVKNT